MFLMLFCFFDPSISTNSLMNLIYLISLKSWMHNLSWTKFSANARPWDRRLLGRQQMEVPHQPGHRWAALVPETMVPASQPTPKTYKSHQLTQCHQVHWVQWLSNSLPLCGTKKCYRTAILSIEFKQKNQPCFWCFSVFWSINIHN